MTSLKEFSMSYKAGYPASDKMRENADTLLNKSKGDMKMTSSASAKGKEKMRPYAEGGHVCHKKTLPLDLHMPKLRHKAGGGAIPMDEGGVLPSTSNAIPMKKGRKVSRAEDNLTPHSNSISLQEFKHRLSGHAKGGKTKKFAIGGYTGTTSPLSFNEMHGLPLNPVPGRLYKKGGSAGMGTGAAVSNERATKAPRMVRGNKADARGTAEVNLSASKAPRRIKEAMGGAIPMDEGGALQVKKFAMGGVGKMRHGEMTKKGMPIKKRGARSLEETY